MPEFQSDPDLPNDSQANPYSTSSLTDAPNPNSFHSGWITVVMWLAGGVSALSMLMFLFQLRMLRDSAYGWAWLIGHLVRAGGFAAVVLALREHSQAAKQFDRESVASVAALRATHKKVWFTIAMVTAALLAYGFLSSIWMMFAARFESSRYTPAAMVAPVAASFGLAVPRHKSIRQGLSYDA